MKKIFFVLVLAGIISLLISCSALSADVKSEKKNNGVSKVTFALADSGAGSRTIMPNEMTLDDVVKVELTAERISSDSDSDEVLPDVEEAAGFTREWNSIKDFKSGYISLLYGKYDFTLVLKTAYSSVDSNEHVSQTAKLEGVEISKETTTLTFNTSYADNGCLLVTLYWPADSNDHGRFGAIKGSLVPYGKAEGTAGSDGTASDGTISSDGTSGTAVSEEDASGSDSDEGTFYDFDALSIYPDDQMTYAPEKGYYYAQYMLNNVPNGKYYLYFKFYDTEDTECTNALNTITDIVYIHGFKTEEVIPLDVKEFNAFYNIDYDTALGSWAEDVFDNLVTRRNAYTAVTLPGADEISREGYIFKGWKVQKKAESDSSLVFEDETSDGKGSADGTTGVISTDDGAGVTGGTSGADTTAQIITKIGVGRDTAMDYQLVAVWEEKAVAQIDANLNVITMNEVQVQYTWLTPVTCQFEVTDSSRFTDYEWTVDGNRMTESETNPAILEVPMDDWLTGTYDIALTVKDLQGNLRSWYYQFHWTHKYKISFETYLDEPEDEKSVPDQYVVEGSKITSPKMTGIENDGLIFAGWYTSEELWEEFDFTEAPTDDCTIYAAWVQKNSGSIAVNSKILDIGVEYKTLYLNCGEINFTAKSVSDNSVVSDDENIYWNAELYYGGNLINSEEYGTYYTVKNKATALLDDNGNVVYDEDYNPVMEPARLVIAGKRTEVNADGNPVTLQNDILETGGTYQLYVTAAYKGVKSSANFDIEVQNKEYFEYTIDPLVGISYNPDFPENDSDLAKQIVSDLSALKAPALVVVQVPNEVTEGSDDISYTPLHDGDAYKTLNRIMNCATNNVELDVSNFVACYNLDDDWNDIIQAESGMFDSTRITSLKLPVKITTISAGALGEYLTSVYLHQYVNTIESGVFDNLKKLEKIVVDEKNGCYKSAQNDSILIEMVEDPDDHSVTETVIACAKNSASFTNLDFSSTDSGLAGVSVINDDVFKGFNFGLISFGSNIKTIGTGAFKETKVTTVNFGNVKTISQNAFESSEISSIDFGSVETIEDYAFRSANISNIDFKNVKVIGEEAFGNSALSSINFGSVQVIGYRAFTGCTKLMSVTIPSSVRAMNRRVFQSCGFDETHYTYSLVINFEDESGWYELTGDSDEAKESKWQEYVINPPAEASDIQGNLIEAGDSTVKAKLYNMLTSQQNDNWLIKLSE